MWYFFVGVINCIIICMILLITMFLFPISILQACCGIDYEDSYLVKFFKKLIKLEEDEQFTYYGDE